MVQIADGQFWETKTDIFVKKVMSAGGRLLN